MKTPKLCFTISTLLLFTGPTISAQVVLDGTLGKSGALPGPDYQVEANLGQQHGSNLFHSFQDFNLQSHESATFSGPSNVTNVISRVTGGQPSNIDGTIRSTIPHADLYFLNPSGMMFGPHAKLDVQGGFHASTADYLRLSDGGRFEARTPSNSLLTVAPVAAFGFLTPTPAPITLQESRLAVPEQQTLSLVGGDLSLTGQLVLDDTGKPRFNVFKHPLAPLSIPVYTSQLTAPAGQINLASIATSGELPWRDSHLDLTTPLLGGAIRLEKTDLNVNGPGGGNIFIRAGWLKLTNSHLESQTLGDQDGGVIDVGADNFLMRGGEYYAGIHANTWGIGRGSTIKLQARQMDLAEGVFINASTYQFGNPGNIRMSVAETLNFEGQYLPVLKLPSGIFNTVLSLQPDLDQENPSTMEIEAGSINLLKGAEINSVTFGVKDSANIHLQVHDALTIAGILREDNAAFGSSFTFPSGIISNSYMGYETLIRLGINYPNAGNGGHIQIQAGQISLDDHALISSRASNGNSGNIEIHSQQLLVKNSGIIIASVLGKGQGGKLQITVTDQLRLSGNGQQEGQDQLRYTGLHAGAFTNPNGVDGGNSGTIDVAAKHLIIEDSAQINVGSETAGHAGHLRLKVGQLEIRTGGMVVSSTTKGSGNGGEISIQAHEIVLSDAGLINSSGFSRQGGKAGNILIEADSLTLLSGGNISVSSLGVGAPGKIKVKVSGNLLLSGQADNSLSIVPQFLGRETSSYLSEIGVPPTQLVGHSKIDAAVISQGTESAGTIEIEAKHLEIQDGAEISSAHEGAGDAGDILIQADRIRLERGSLTTETKGGGGGGGIEIHLPGLLYLIEGKITTSVGTGKGRGGDVTIDHPSFSVLTHSQIKAQADEGQGGNIQIVAHQFVASSDSLISASAKRGIDGQVVISAPNENISDSLFALNKQLNEVVQLRHPCGAMNFEAFLQRSSFYIFRIAGSPQVPEDWHPSPYLSVREASSPSTVNPSKPSSPPHRQTKSPGSVLIALECKKRKG